MAATEDKKQMISVEGVDAGTQAKLSAVFSVFDKEEEVTEEELKRAFGAIKVELSAEKVAGMKAVVEGEKKKKREELVLEADALQSHATDGNEVLRRRQSGQKELLATPSEGVATVWDLFQHGVSKFPDNNCLGTRDGDKYVWQNYKESDALVRAYGAGLKATTGIERGDFVGINLKTQANWTVAHLANGAYALATVTLYDTYGKEALQYIVQQTELKVLLAGEPQLATLSAILPECPTVKHIILAGVELDSLDADLKTALSADGRQLHTFDSIVAAGQTNPLPLDPAVADDILVICYTSGTTGMPKGVIQTHGSMVASVAGGREVLAITPNDVHIAFLPLAHVMELWLEAIYLHDGVALGYYGGDVRELMSDIQLLKPTLFVGVPRLLNRIYGNVMMAAKGKTGIPALLTQLAIASKKKGLTQHGRLHSYWDWIVFDKIRAVLGGRVRIIATGSAPISPDVLAFLKLAFSCPVQEGYGTSEVLVTNVTNAIDHMGGTVGPPFSSTEVRLIDVPEMDYLTTDKPLPRGEVQVRGPSVMKGYYKNEEKTKEVLSDDGWYSTGDIGTFLANGTLKIVDRRKDIFKLSQGEYCAPAKIENIYVRSPFIAQAFVHGDSLRPSLVAVVVPDPEYLPKWAAAQQLEGDLPILLKNVALKAAILESIQKVSTEAKIPKYEIVSDIHIFPEAFSGDNDLLTPTFKLKRFVARNFFAKEIAAMYCDDE